MSTTIKKKKKSRETNKKCKTRQIIGTKYQKVNELTMDKLLSMSRNDDGVEQKTAGRKLLQDTNGVFYPTT